MIATVATEEVWTFDADPEAGHVRPIRTSCKAGEFGYPNDDIDGRSMFDNTHFHTEAKAWKALLANAEAGQNIATRGFRRAQEALRVATERLATSAAFASEVRQAHRETPKPKETP